MVSTTNRKSATDAQQIEAVEFEHERRIAWMTDGDVDRTSYREVRGAGDDT